MKTWKNPVKGIPPKESTLNIKGDFREFTELMKKVVNKQEDKPKPVSSSRVPDAS